MRAPPSPGKAHVSPSNCRNFIFAFSTFPSLLSLQPLGWVSWTQGYPSRGSEVHPRVFWRRMFQGFRHLCVLHACTSKCCVQGCGSGQARGDVAKALSTQNGDQHARETEESQGHAPCCSGIHI